MQTKGFFGTVHVQATVTMHSCNTGNGRKKFGNKKRQKNVAQF